MITITDIIRRYGANKSFYSEIAKLYGQTTVIFPAQVGTTDSNIVFPASASAVDDYYNDMKMHFVGGKNDSEERWIIDYDGTTKTAELSYPLPEIPDVLDLTHTTLLRVINSNSYQNISYFGTSEFGLNEYGGLEDLNGLEIHYDTLANEAIVKSIYETLKPILTNIEYVTPL